MEELGAGDPVRVGPYALVARLGAGGMGTVYLALTPGGRRLAVKTVRPELASDPAFRERFRREADALARVSGLWTAQVVDADADAAVPWIATSYLDAPDLARHQREHGPLPEPRLRTLAADLVEALSAIHRAGLVHRDLKPTNILLTDDGPRVIDFGIAKSATDSITLTTLGGVIGTPGFMSPEQATGEAVGPATDVFSLGAVLCFAASGTGPFRQGTVPALLYRIVHDDPDLHGVPRALHAVVATCLAKQPEHRPGLSELARMLGECAPSNAESLAYQPPGRPAGNTWWWEQTTIDASGVPRRPPPGPSPAAAPTASSTLADQMEEPMIAWWSAGDQELDERAAGPGFPVGRQVAEAHAQRRRAIDHGRAPGPRVEEPLEAGDVVEHSKFGVGTVLEIEDGPDPSALIAFGPRHKERRILIRLAPLRKLDYGA